jgi:thiamine biosynthesis lipoprotein
VKTQRDERASVDVFEAGGVHRFSHEAMATVFEVRIAHGDPVYAGQAAEAAFALVDRLEQELSRFVANSDVSRIGALRAGEEARVGPSTMDCLVIARHVHALTGGAFDVSIGTGLERLELRPDDLAVRATADGIRIDLGGIGKGYAVDRMAAVLEEWGLERALVHGGFSSVLALEAPPGRAGWPLALRLPATPAGSSGAEFARVEARQLALSASGTRKGDHIVDPRTGRSVESGAAWAALPRSRGDGHAPAAVADALTTAFMLLKRRQVEALCRANPGLEAWLVGGGKRRAVAHVGDHARPMTDPHQTRTSSTDGVRPLAR